MADRAVMGYVSRLVGTLSEFYDYLNEKRLNANESNPASVPR